MQSEVGPASYPVIAPHGVDGWVVRFSENLNEESNRAALALYAALESGAIDGVEEASSALVSVYVRAGMKNLETVERALNHLLQEEDFYSKAMPGGRKLWRIPAAFGGQAGPSFEILAGEIGLSVDDALRDLTETRVRVLAIGFGPGQPYLGELPQAWNVPRLTDLIDVPASALIVAIRQLVIMANPSPTGWQHVGQTAFRTYRPEEAAPFTLSPGDEVMFTRVTDEELENLRHAPGNGGAVSEPLS